MNNDHNTVKIPPPNPPIIRWSLKWQEQEDVLEFGKGLRGEDGDPLVFLIYLF